MPRNLFIAYDLMSPGQNYAGVCETIESLGQYYKFQQSLYYLHTDLEPHAVFNAVQCRMDSNDKLAVIIADGGIVTNWDAPPIDQINQVWHRA